MGFENSSQQQCSLLAAPAASKKGSSGLKCVHPRKPPASEPGARRAQRRDIESSSLKRTACQVYGALCDCLDYSSYSGLAWPKVETLARRLKVAVRTVQRGLEELVSAGWIGAPVGDAGGREGVVYHLHPDGKPCLFCVAAERTIYQRGKHAISRGDILAPVRGDMVTPVPPTRGDISAPVPPAKGDILASRGDIFDSAYKERHSVKTLPNSTTTTNEELPEEFVHEMDQECQLDEGALRRIWREARQIVPDATPQEVRHFFRERALVVGRNRRVQNPVGLLLSTIPDWFSARHVLARREEERRAREALAAMQEELAQLGLGRERNRLVT